MAWWIWGIAVGMIVVFFIDWLILMGADSRKCGGKRNGE